MLPGAGVPADDTREAQRRAALDLGPGPRRPGAAPGADAAPLAPRRRRRCGRRGRCGVELAEGRQVVAALWRGRGAQAQVWRGRRRGWGRGRALGAQAQRQRVRGRRQGGPRRVAVAGRYPAAGVCRTAHVKISTSTFSGSELRGLKTLLQSKLQ